MLENKKFVIVILVFYYLSSVYCRKEAVFLECDPSKASAEKSNSECPENSQCVEVGTKTNSSKTNDSVAISLYGGLCACKVNYTVNRSYSSSDSNNAQYCIESNKTTQTTAVPPQQQNVSTIPTPIVKSTAAPPSETLKSTLAPSPAKTTSQPTKKVEPTAKHEESNESANKNDNKDKQPEKQQQTNNVPPQTHHIFGGIVLPIMVVLAFLGVVFGIRKYDVLERTQNYIRNRRNGHTHQTRYDGLENDFDDDPLLI